MKQKKIKKNECRVAIKFSHSNSRYCLRYEDSEGYIQNILLSSGEVTGISEEMIIEAINTAKKSIKEDKENNKRLAVLTSFAYKVANPRNVNKNGV